MKQDLPKLVFSTLLPNPNGSGYFKVMLLSDGSTTCTCGQCTPTVECEHIHPLVVEYLRSVERRDDVVEGIVEHRRDNTLAALRRQEIPRGTVLKLTAYSLIRAGEMVRLLPNGKACVVGQGPAIGMAISNSREGKVEVRVDYVPAPQPQPNPQVFTRDRMDSMIGAMQIGLPAPKHDFIGIDFAEIAVPPLPLPRRKFRL